MILKIFKMWNRIIVEGCLTFPVNLKWFQVLVLCTAATTDCRLTHGINLDYRKVFLENKFSTFESPRDHPQRIQCDNAQRNREAAPKAGKTKTIHTSEDRQNHGTIPMPTFATKPLTTSSTLLVELRCTTWSDSKDSKYRNCNSTNSLIHNRFWCGNTIQNSSDWFSIGCSVVDQRSGDGWFFGRVKIPAISLWKGFSNFEMLDAKIASALNKIIQNSQFKKKVSLEEQKAQKEDRFLWGRQIAFMIHDNFRMTGAHDTVLDYAEYSLLLFMMKTFRNSIQDGTKFCGRCQKCRPMISWKVCEIDKTVLELYDMEIHQKISMPNYQKLKTMV